MVAIIDGLDRYYPECRLCDKEDGARGTLAQLAATVRNYLRRLAD